MSMSFLIIMKKYDKLTVREVYTRVMKDRLMTRLHNNITQNFPSSSRKEWEYEYNERLSYLHEVAAYISGTRITVQVWPREFNKQSTYYN